MIARRCPLVSFGSFLFGAIAAATTAACAEPALPPVTGVPAQPLAVHARQLVEALEFTGSPLDPEARARLDQALAAADEATVAAGVQAVFDPPASWPCRSIPNRA